MYFTRFTLVFWMIMSGVLSPALGQENIGGDSFADALVTAGEMPRLHSLLISHSDQLVIEKYYNGRTARRTANVKSVSKSIMSALIGIAIERGHVAGLDQPISEHAGRLIPDLSGTPKADITVGNLLSMQAGLETTSFYNFGKWVLSDNWIKFALNQPLRADPGNRLLYSTGNTHLLSAILTQATGQSTLSFAREVLGQPLGFELASWTQDPQGVYFGGNNMELTPRQMLAFGRLYLNEGRHNEQQIIPQSWVKTSLQPLIESPREEGRYYGYGWWSREMAGTDTAFAWGYGGQFILLVKELDLVVVATSNSQPGSDRRRHIRRLYDLLENKVVRVVANAARVDRSSLTD